MASYSYYNTNQVLSDLDEMVKNREDTDYQELRSLLSDALKQYFSPNPFGAGPPRQYTEEDKEKMQKLRKEGKTMKAIALEMKCSASTVCRVLHRND